MIFFFKKLSLYFFHLSYYLQVESSTQSLFKKGDIFDHKPVVLLLRHNYPQGLDSEAVLELHPGNPVARLQEDKNLLEAYPRQETPPGSQVLAS